MARNRMAGTHPSYDKKGMTPEQIKKKVAYDSKYQKTKKRVKYRVELNRINRKKGRVGDGKDVSHTKGGGTVLEDASKNRSRNGHSKKGKNRSRLK